ncbi:MAG TPA: FliA/WhiG family RNA polymerase sigma factor [Candidatus Acidoferrales bacterium]|nr:FliA/WhiG family RNA polymerase sigma factor [Candidatus Acidoferrales bacterium]
MTDLIDALWARYRRNGDPGARSQLLDRYLGLVHHSAHQLARRISRDVEIDDLIGAGTLGLVQALEGFDPGRGLAFSTYAMPRIRGAMLDELRARDWMPRSVRMRSRQLQGARAALQHRLGRQPTHEEVADALELDLSTYWRWNEEVDGRVFLQLDGGGGDGDERPPRLADSIADVLADDPADVLDDRATLARLREAIDHLSSRDRLVLSLYYYEELNLRQIGEILHVSESRISQIRTRALKRLRDLVDLVEDEAA